jgi:hypothetical protein
MLETSEKYHLDIFGNPLSLKSERLLKLQSEKKEVKKPFYKSDENYKVTTGYKFKFRGTAIIQTEVKEWVNGNWDKVRTRQNENLRDNKTRGLLSEKAKQKLKGSINWLVVAAQKKTVKSMKSNNKYKFKINFITLTIPPQSDELVDEKKFKTILNTWLTYQRKMNKLNNYVWKVEKHKDNRLHIHILSDTFLHHRNVRNSWNTILQRNGLLESHYNKFKNYDPNSTDIHSIKQVKKVAAYVVKYMAKDGAEDKLYMGRVWSCSSKLSHVMQNSLEVCPDKINEVVKPLMDKRIEAKQIFTQPNIFGNCYEVAQMYFLKPSDWIILKGSKVYDVFKELILYLRSDKQIIIDFNLVLA